MLEKRITDVLKELQVPMGNLGFLYIRKAIELVINNETCLRNLTKVGGIYETIAKEFNSTSQRVERAIRHAIETVFSSADSSVLKKYFGHSSGKETNKNFIAYLAYEVKNKEEQE
jgi:two-component system response regulator (stage 0 sporulation protein A)